jgi:hypothetical protein
MRVKIKKLFIIFCVSLIVFSLLPIQETKAADAFDLGQITTNIVSDPSFVTTLMTALATNGQSLPSALGQMAGVIGAQATLDFMQNMYAASNGTPSFVSDGEITNGGVSFKRDDACDHDYFCYISDDSVAPIYYGYVVKKVSNEASFVFFIPTPNAKFPPDMDIWDHLYLYNTSSTSLMHPVPLKSMTIQGSSAQAPQVFSTKKVNLNYNQLFNGGLTGKVVFQDKVLNPSFFGSLGSSAYMDYGYYYSFGTQALSASKYSDSTNSLSFSIPKDTISISSPTVLYTNTQYYINLTGAKGGTDCTTGALTTTAASAILSTIAGCSTEYTGSILVTLDENGKMTVVNPKAGEEVNNGKLLTDGVTISGTTNVTSPLDAALSSAIGTLGSWVQVTTKWVMQQINSLLSATANYVIGSVGCTGSACGVLGPWTAMRNIGLTLLVMALIIIAFANVLQIDIEQYGLNRMIPKIIISIILAMASWVIVVFFFDFTNAIQSQAIGLLGGTSGLDVLGKLTINTPTAGDLVGKAGAILLLLVILIGVLICGIVLFFMLIMRIVMLSFLLAVAPLAFILNVVPFTSGLYKQWWSEFWKWMFMGPVALIIISLGSVIAASVSGSQFGSGATLDATSIGSDVGGRMLIGLIIFGASMYIAATLPLKWGGDIMKGWNKVGKGAMGLAKKGWSNTAGRYTTQPIAGAWKGWRTNVNNKTQQGVDRRTNSLLNTASGNRYGMDKDLYATNQEASLLNAESKLVEFRSKEDLTSALDNTTNPFRRKAILLAGARENLIDTDPYKKELAEAASSDKTGLLEAAAKKDYNTELMQYGNQDVASRAAWDMTKKYSEAKSGDLDKLKDYIGGSGDFAGKEINASERGKTVGFLSNITQANADKLGQTKGQDYLVSLNALRATATGGTTGPSGTSTSTQQGSGASSPGGYRGTGEDD